MMMKKLLVLIACTGLAFHVTGCTSNDSKPDAEVTSDFDSADLEKLEGDEALDIAGDDSLTSDSLAEDALGESKPSEVTTTTETTTTIAETTPAMDHATTDRTDVATNTETLPADPFAESTTSDAIPPAPSSDTFAATDTASSDSTAMVESTTSTTTSSYESSSSTPAAPKVSAPLQKFASAPWQVGKTWYNTVYFARPGDSLASVSQMIYGSDKTAELKKGNPSYKSRSLKPGDKVYYNSPHRAEDSARVITYYEDNGMAPQTYVAQEGDNIRKVSKSLLGYDGAWKEVWSSNSVDSKGALAAGTELRYWTGGAAPAAPHQELATNANPNPNAATDAGQLPPPPAMDQGQFPPPPDMAMQDAPPQDIAQAQSDFPPPPPMPEMAPPPPPQDMAMAPPPPPPPETMAPSHQPQAHEEPAAGMDSDTTMALAVVGLAAAGLAVLIVMRKKRRQKELEQQAMSDTHVG